MTSKCRIFLLVTALLGAGCSDDASNPLNKEGQLGAKAPGRPNQGGQSGTTGGPSGVGSLDASRGTVFDAAIPTDVRALDAGADMPASLGSRGGAGGGGGNSGGGGIGAMSGQGGAAAMKNDGGLDGPAPIVSRCAQCEAKYCKCNTETPELAELVKGCYEAEGKVLNGRKANVPRKELCKEIVDCVRSSGCMKGQGARPEGCFCGTAGAECGTEGKANGACKELLSDGAELDISIAAPASTIGMRINSTGFTSGKAMQLIVCDKLYCPEECLGISPPDGGFVFQDPPNLCEGNVDGGMVVPERTDASPVEDAGAVDASPDGSYDGSTDAGPRLVLSAQCRQCINAAKDENLPASEACSAVNGCEALSGTDRELCQSLLDCMVETKCWQISSNHDPKVCLCGSARGASCGSGGANGLCKAQAEAATKTKSPASVGIRFFQRSDSELAVIPAGYATNPLACGAANCYEVCKDPVIEGSEPDAGIADASPDVSPDTSEDSASAPDASPDLSLDLAPDVSDPIFPVSASCLTCERENIANGSCEPEAGCDSLSGTDKTLCLSALWCMRANPNCWEVNPQKCLCGNVTGTTCATAPQGVCRNELAAAAKTVNNGVTDWTTTGLRFFSMAFPVGHATTLLTCDIGYCKSECRDGGAGPVDAPVDVPADAPVNLPDAPIDAPLDPPVDMAVDTFDLPPVMADAPADDAPVDMTPTPPLPPGTCPDLDSNGVQDCQQSLVLNSDFKTAVSPWMVDSSALQEWVTGDAQGSATSGAIAASNISYQAGGTSVGVAGPTQCVPVNAGPYKVWGQAFILGTEGPGSATISVFFYSGATPCQVGNPLIHAYSAPVVTARDTWSLFQGATTAPAGTTSMVVKLGLQKVSGQMSLKAFFDNILIAPSP